THPHADHIHGIDDLRGYVHDQRHRIDIHADEPTMRRMREAFGYCFETPPGSSYPPIVKAHIIDHATPVMIEGEGGALTLQPLPQFHGDIISLGCPIGGLTYCP
ncbi:MBL fold metallo-hydrolase, partial [Mesorhizobium sp. M4B.F.Ca.ET.172.01.1.1]|uniref:MBL fold metallo-hydrolase n=1 Tax=Mesorhizobium sp. M4B.F.Ca.ET.172.01.1.1 TaxID=2563950 RepID=UPI001133BD93